MYIYYDILNLLFGCAICDFVWGMWEEWRAIGSSTRKSAMTRQHGKHQATWSFPKTGVPKNGWFILEKPIWLVVSTPLINMSSSVGSMTFPTEWKVIKFMFQTTSNHQPAIEMDENWGYPQFRKPPYGDQRGVARLESFCDSLPVQHTDRFMRPKHGCFSMVFNRALGCLRMP